MSENSNNQNSEIDPIVQNLLPDYVNSRRLEIFTLQRLLSENSFEKIRLIGHNLRGSGGLYGLKLISNMGQEIEEFALSGNQVGLQNSIQALSYFLDSLDY